MSHQIPRQHDGRRGPQAGWGNQQNQQAWFQPPPVDFLHGEIQRLSYLLEMEKGRWFEENQKVVLLEAQLEETKLEVKRQKNLKEMFINKGKETKRELERVEKLSDSQTLSTVAIASIVHNDMKYKKKKMLQKDFEELKVAHILLQESFSSQIQAEKDKNIALQEELDKLKTSYQEFPPKCKDVAAEMQHVGIQTENEQRTSEIEDLLENLRAEKEDFVQKTSQEMAALQERENSLQRQLDQLQVSYQELNCRYEKDVSALKQQTDTYQQALNCFKNTSSERERRDLQLINDLRAEKDDIYQKMSQEMALLQEKEKQSEREVEQVREKYQEMTCMYEKGVSLLKQQVEMYQKEVDLRAEQDLLKENASKEISFLQKKEKRLQREMDEIQVLYQELNSRYETDVSALKQQVETLKQEKNIHKEHQQEICVPAYSDLDTSSEENLSETRDFTEASAEDMNKGAEETLQGSSHPDFGITDAPEMKSDMNNPDTKLMAGAGKETKAKRTVWKKLRRSLGFRTSKK